MQNPQCEIHPSKIRTSGQVTPPTAFLALSRRHPAAALLAETGGNEMAEANHELSSQLAHDARNLIAAFELSCEVLASPGVLAPGFGHYATDLRRLAESAGRLIEALVEKPAKPALRRFPRPSGLDARQMREARIEERGRQVDPLEVHRVELRRHPFPEIEDLAEELMALEGRLRALAGQEVSLEIECLPCAGRLALNSEDLLRILLNLIVNAVEAMARTPAELRRRPSLRITAQRGGAASFLPRHGQRGVETLVLAVRDNGPGIAAEDLPHIFDSGFSTRRAREGADAASHHEYGQVPRGLGLAIVRKLVTAAGGAVRAVSPAGFGVRFDIELPVIVREAEDFGPALGQGKMELPHLQQISAQIEKEA